ncbi:hypothetical protein KSC_040090 [Ktedonobacter sp. SOSP1-52]|nr:hypothetical protein KSC_040090 [Ktedonobacter sp. SOSP1-52]
MLHEHIIPYKLRIFNTVESSFLIGVSGCCKRLLPFLLLSQWFLLGGGSLEAEFCFLPFLVYALFVVKCT